MTSLLETALTLLGVVLVLALAAQSIQEIIKAAFALKGHTTLQALEHLVTESARSHGQTATDAEEIVKALRARLRALGHRGVRSGAVRLESVSAEQLGDLVRGVSPDDVAGLRALEPGAARQRLREIAQRVESWYSLAMTPLDERYRRRMRGLSIVSSAIVVLAVNADAFEILRKTRQDPAYRARVISLAMQLDSLAAGAGADSARVNDSARAAARAGAGDSPAGRDSAGAATGTATRRDAPAAASRLDSAGLLALAALNDDLFVEGPEGWRPTSYSWWVGILLSIALVSLGAPFWHDALEALFGLKSRLRAEARNLERRAPAPAPRTTDDSPPAVQAPNAVMPGMALPAARRRTASEPADAPASGAGRSSSGDTSG